jgi:hypothetical protein
MFLRRKGKIIMNGKLERITKKTVVAYLWQHHSICLKTEETHEKPVRIAGVRAENQKLGRTKMKDLITGLNLKMF